MVARASRDDELILRGTLADIADQVHAADIRRTAVIIVGQVLKRNGDLVLEWRGRTRLEGLGDSKAYKLLVGDKHVPLGKFGQAAAGDGALYNGANAASSARVAGRGYGLAPSPESPFNSNFGSYHQGGICQFVTADGAVKTFTPSVDEAVLGLMADRHAPPENK